MKEDRVAEERSNMLAVCAPQFAPLPISFASHVWNRCEEAPKKSSQGETLETQLTRLLAQIATTREVAFRYMDSFIVTRSFSTGWVRETLATHSPDKSPVPPSTFHSWLDRGLFQYDDFGLPNKDTSAALFILRMLDNGKWKWLPKTKKTEEPLWWCWRQDAPDMSPIPCPMPLPELPPTTLLWTSWAGAAWQPNWHALGSWAGAIRFAGRRTRRRVHWGLTYHELQHWMPFSIPQETVSFLAHTHEYYDIDVETWREQMLHTYATSVLEQIALQKFGKMSSLLKSQ